MINHQSNSPIKSNQFHLHERIPPYSVPTYHYENKFQNIRYEGSSQVNINDDYPPDLSSDTEDDDDDYPTDLSSDTENDDTNETLETPYSNPILHNDNYEYQNFQLDSDPDKATLKSISMIFH